LLTLLLLCAALAHAQETAPRVTEKEPATVYVYRFDYDWMIPWIFNKTLPVYFTEGKGAKQRKIAGLRRKRYFMLRLPPGSYFFDTRLMRGKLKLEAVAGGEYYLRVDQGTDCPNNGGCDSSDCTDRNPSVELMPLERAREEMLKVKPLKPNNVQDHKLVIIPPEKPAVNQTSSSARSGK
jgi:hypothetical protein